MIKLLQRQFNPIEVNTYIAYDETGECVIIDAGCSNANENEILRKAIAEKNLNPTKLLCTHGHFDHIMGSAFVCDTYKIETYIHKNDLTEVERATDYGSYFGVDVMQPPIPRNFLNDGDEIKFGNSSLKVIFTPGHTHGGVCFYSEADELLISGDTLFAGSIGRTDLPGGDYDILMNSIEKLMCLPENTNVFCGHGPKTTIGYEKTTNPFITDRL
jgi:glyoxylase-like metal-dependent hydrolase (beta-lactamase superfamily II)